MFGRRKVATLMAEFLGTGVLTLLILSVQRSTIGVPFFVALAGGLTMALMTFALGAYATSFFNPAITLGLWTARRLSTLTAVLSIVLQLLGAYLAYLLYSYFVKSSLQNVGGHFTARILVAETVGTGVFAFGVASALYQRLSPAVTSSVVGLSYMVGVVAASSAAIGLLNPAVALGVKAWVWGTYVLGPVIGALVGVNLYKYVFGPLVVAEDVVAAPVTTSTSAVAAKPAAKRRTTAARAKAPAKRRTTRATRSSR